MKRKFLDPMSFLAKCVAGQGGGGGLAEEFFSFSPKNAPANIRYIQSCHAWLRFREPSLAK